MDLRSSSDGTRKGNPYSNGATQIASFNSWDEVYILITDPFE